MKTVVLGLSLTLIAAHATAAEYAWVRSGKSVAIAMDIGTIRRTGDYARALVLMTPPLPNPTEIRSLAVFSEYDCGERRSRDLTSTAFDGSLQIVMTWGEKPWGYVTPGTAGESLLNMACSPGTIDPKSVSKDVGRETFQNRAQEILNRTK